MFRWNKFIPIIFFISTLVGQSITTIDTLVFEAGQTQVQLKPFIVDNSLLIFHEGKLFEEYEINYITGIVDIQENGIFHVSYNYLEEQLPLQIGPLYERLPQLDSLLISSADSIQIKSNNISQQIQDDDSDLAATGTVYRNLTLSPLGGSDFSGGLQLQLQGKLSNDITVSGVLSDQSLPIQPEGTTQNLEEIDKVYLHVRHPIFQLMAGDIDYNLNSGNFLTVDRKLEGIKNTFVYERYSGQSAVAATKGRYHKLSFKGTDGSQGPYSLTSETGNKDIIVLAGTEKVYIDDELLKRGENFDYVINYSVGEITFTPRQLIDFDTDIYIEYQYSDFQYSRNVLSASVNRDLGKWGNVGLAWFKEKDQLQIDESFSIGLRDSLKNSGDDDTIISGAVKDDGGKYLLIDNIFVYSPSTTDNSDSRYNVSFQNDNDNGQYARRISDTGHLYFEFIDVENRLDYVDLYSPSRKWSNPVDHSIFQVVGNTKISKKAQAIWDVSLSNLDKNTFSSIDDDDNIGLAHNISISAKEIVLFKKGLLGYNITNWRRANNFNEVSKDRNANFGRDWNVESEELGKESLFSSGFNFQIDKFINSKVEWSQYNSTSGKRNRLTGKLNSSSKYLPQFNSYLNRVQANQSNFYQYNINGMFLPGKFHPIFSYNGEYEKNKQKFDVRKIGFLFSGNKQNIAASITQRTDLRAIEADSTKMDIVQEGIFGELDINTKSSNGWSSKIVFKKRISDNLIKNEKLDYAIGLANIRFNNKTSPIRWELHSKLEETYTESRAVVYDSIGVGLGAYRYDSEFNEYISDPNGAFISHTILTGDRELTTHLIGSQRLFIDFEKSKIKLLKNIDFRSDLRTEYRGEILTFDKIINPDLNDNGIASSKFNLRNEIDFNPIGSTRRIRNWVNYSQNLFGNDPRGNDLRNLTEYGIEWSEPINDEIHSILQIETHKLDNSSGFSDLRNRKIDGWWLDESIKWKIERKWQFTASILGGEDQGSHNQNVFSAYAYGIKIEVQRFISSNSRIKFRTDLFNSTEKKGNTIIPPEALNGLPLGQSLSINIQGQLLLGKNLSLNTSASYIDNSRYDNFITISGELRAYF